MESPESLSTPSLATVFFDKFEKDELQELLSTKPHDWLFAQNIVDEKVFHESFIMILTQYFMIYLSFFLKLDMVYAFFNESF